MKNRLIGTICAAVMLLALFAPMAMADGVCGESGQLDADGCRRGSRCSVKAK